LNWARNPEAARRFAERRQREDEAPRLAETVPKLLELGIKVIEGNPGMANPEGAHTRRVVVASAPALFVMPCGDSQCREGGHDLTVKILSALRAEQKAFEGEDCCHGVIGTANCRRVLRYIATATYRT